MCYFNLAKHGHPTNRIPRRRESAIALVCRCTWGQHELVVRSPGHLWMCTIHQPICFRWRTEIAGEIWRSMWKNIHSVEMLDIVKERCLLYCYWVSSCKSCIRNMNSLQFQVGDSLKRILVIFSVSAFAISVTRFSFTRTFNLFLTSITYLQLTGSSLPLWPSVLGSLAKDSSQYTSEVYFQVRKMVNKTPH